MKFNKGVFVKESEDKWAHCGCFCHKIIGFMAILIGITFLLGTYDVISPKIVGTVWPILLILAGARASIMKGMCKCCDKAKCEG